jgi:hypothetical protein
MYNKDTRKGGCEIVDGIPESGCRFEDNEVSGNQKYASIMYRTNLDHVSHHALN